METIKHGNLTIKIRQDDFAESPREWCNVGTMVCWHPRYTLGDEQPDHSPEDYLLRLMQNREFHQKRKCVPDDIDLSHVAKYVDKHFLVLPLYLYDHSGISMSASMFGCQWDSGKVGFIYAERRQTDSFDLLTALLDEVKVYNQYLTGEVYEYAIKDEEDNLLDSCCGFFGFEQCKEDALAEAKSITDQLQTSFAI
jgi:hypothetical protein